MANTRSSPVKCGRNCWQCWQLCWQHCWQYRKCAPLLGNRPAVGYIVIYLLVYEKSKIYCIDTQVNSCIGHECALALTILPTMPTPCNKAQCNTTARTRRAHTGAKCWHCLLLKTNSQQCQQSTGTRPDAVGTANNANTVRLLHELTIVSLLHELSMVAVARWPEGWGGRALAEGQR